MQSRRTRSQATTSTMKLVSVAATVVAILMSASPAAAHPSSAHSSDPIYLDPHYTFAERAADLVARLTPTERASQLVSSQAPAITTTADPLLKDTFGGQTTLAAPAHAGDTNLKVESTGGMAVGAHLTIDPGGTPETVTVTSVGSGPSTFFTPTLAVAANPGDTNIKVNFTFGMTAGDVMRIDSGSNVEFAAIQSVGTSGAGGTGVTFTAPLTLAHPVGAPALDLGSGITVTPALTSAHAFAAPVQIFVGIPAYGWWNEALHGINAESLNPSGNAVTLTNTTSYPIDLSRASSWDPGLTYEVAQAESDEAREIVRNNKFDLDFYSPTINLGRDPRWGRNDESYGEDPLLEAKVASQFVNGMEGKNQDGQLLPQGNGFYKATTTLKHYAMNNTEGFANTDPNGRLNGSSNADDRSIREYYTMPFRKIVQASQPGAIMSSYNEINGVPSAANTYLNDTLMRETFGLQGYFTGDCDAVNQVNTRHHWQPAGLAAPRDGRRAVRVHARIGRRRGVQRRLQRHRQLPRPDLAEHDPGRADERDRDAHHDADRADHGQRPRRVGHAAVHEPDEARRVQSGLDGAVADPGAGSGQELRRVPVGQLKREQRRDRDCRPAGTGA